SIVGNLPVILGDANETGIQAVPESLQQMLGHLSRKSRVESRVGEVARTVGGYPVILKTHAQGRSRRETLRIAEVAHGSVLREHRDNSRAAGSGGNVVGKRLGLPLELEHSAHHGIEIGGKRTGTGRGSNHASRACTRAPGAGASSARSCTADSCLRGAG